MYIFHLQFIRQVSTDPMYREFKTKASELLKSRSLYETTSDKILLPTDGNSNIISNAEMGKVNDDNILTLGASIFVACVRDIKTVQRKQERGHTTLFGKSKNRTWL